MPLSDSPELRELITAWFPELRIDNVAKASGQRLVYFCAVQDAIIPWWNPDREIKQCVLKLAEGVSHQTIAYIQREMDILNSLESPNFPKLLHNNVYSHDPDTEEPFRHKRFVTIEEFIEGRPLSTCFDSFSDELRILELISSVGKAMLPLWQRRPSIVHRDLKPDNILIKTDGAPVIIDLAIAREADQPGVTLSGLPFGPCTPRYASPEQVLNRKIDITFKSDIFALGAIAYELFTGESPFDAGKDDLNDVFDRILNYDPPPLHELSQASHRTSALIGEMLQKEPYRRPRRPARFIANLDEAIRNVS